MWGRVVCVECVCVGMVCVCVYRPMCVRGGGGGLCVCVCRVGVWGGLYV